METSVQRVRGRKSDLVPEAREPAAVETADGQSREPVSELYEMWTLDIVPAIGVTAARAFEMNPKQFTRVPSEIVDVLSVLHFRTGRDEKHLDTSQRLGVLTPLLGPSDGFPSDDSSMFHQAAVGLRKAAVDFVRRSFNTGERQLRDAFRDASLTMFTYLTEIQGAVTDNALARISTHFNDVVSILKNAEYCSGLGLPPAPTGPWPRFGVVDGNGATLIAELSHRVGPDESPQVPPMGVTEFTAVQRIADFGATSLDAVLRDPAMSDNAQADEVIDTVFRWWTALRDSKRPAEVP